jgi:hypothetical protein
MVRQFRALRREAKRVESIIALASGIVDESRDAAVRARSQLEYERGVGALPQVDEPSPADAQLIAALDAFHESRRRIDLPLQESLQFWNQDEDARQHAMSTRNLARAVVNRTARRRFFQQLETAQRCVTATANNLAARLPQSSIDEVARRVRDARRSTVDEAIAAYAQNNARFVATLERLNSVGTTPSGEPRRGIHGGLPAAVAEAVENTTLNPGPLVAILRRYQEFGARYLILQKRVLLGDDMGLGKTVQVLAAMCHLHGLGARHFLVVAPNSVMVNWQREVVKHTELRPVVLHGPSRDAAVLDWNHNGGVAITTYATLPKLVDLLHRADMVAADEAHFAKNPNAMRSRAVQSVLERTDNAVLMTGTALENTLHEMHHLLVVAQPAISDELARIMNPASGRVDPDDMLVALAPVYLRRTQADVLHELPERVVTDEWITLSDNDRHAYTASKPEVMSRRLAVTIGDGSRSSSKYERLLELVDEHRKSKRKIVVFSYFRQVIDDVCVLVGGAPQITGDTSSIERQRIIDEFSSNPDRHVLVSQIDAGGVGINLQAAQVVILMEPQFKPSTEWQAMARVHRMGQSRKVLVHRLLAQDTIEERLVELIEDKARLFAAYAHDSAVRDASTMAVDPGDGVTMEELRKYL